MFDHIVPCGIADRPVTSLAAEGLTYTMPQVVAAVIDAAAACWGPVDEVQLVTAGPSLGPVTPDAAGRPPPAILACRRADASPIRWW